MTSINLLAIGSVGIAIIVGIITMILGAGGAFVVMNFINTKRISEAKSNANKIIENAYAEAKAIKKESILEAKEEIHKLKIEADNEINSKRNEIQKLEDRVISREENLSKKEDSLDKKQENIDRIRIELENKSRDLDKLKIETEEKEKQIIEEISRVAKMSKEEAKEELVKAYTEDARSEAAKIVREIEQSARDEANKKAKEIVTLAIQKCATEHTQEVTVSVVPIPNEEVKGRVIGREGRNIRALEQATGVEVIIDDTPEAITLSGFDPIRREVARIALEKLILDGRIHPARIEDLVNKVQKDIDITIKEAGENAAFEVGIHNLHPELVKILGRLKYRTSYGQNVLNHSIEVSHLAGLLAAEVGADIKLAKRGGLLHDIGKAVDYKIEGTHIQLGVDIAKKYKENAGVIHCIEAHHGGVEFKSIEAILVQVADAISSSRPGARRESLDSYIKRLENLENIGNSFKGVEKTFAIQAGREIRVIVKPDEVNDDQTIFLAKEIAKRIENELEYPGQIKVNVIRELRTTEIAK